MNPPSPLKAKFRFLTPRWLVPILVLAGAASPALGADVIQNGPVSILQGNDKIDPRPGSQGNGDQFNSTFYILPGEGQADLACPSPTPVECRPTDSCGPCVQDLPHQPYYRAYESTTQPVQSNDWWVGAGLQWYVPSTKDGWVIGYNPANNKPHTSSFISEPFAYDFVDFPEGAYGLRLWNQNAIAVKTDGKLRPSDPFNPVNNEIDRAFLAPVHQEVVTVGLENVHPLSQYLGPNPPAAPPWTNVKVRSYSDWGVVLAYANNASEMEITMANGSPFTWLERKQGQANFLVWVGGPYDPNPPVNNPRVWQNTSVGQLAVLGVTVENVFNADNSIGPVVSKAAYLVIADQGSWVPEPSPIPSPAPQQLKFRNATATKVVVLAMPHNIRLDNDRALQDAATNLLPFACRKIVGSRVDYPPVPESTPSVTINGQTVNLGYSPTEHRVALQLRLQTQPFFTNCMADCTTTSAVPIQLLFPHHYKSLHPGQKMDCPGGGSGCVDTRYQWHSLKGPLRLYQGCSFVELIDTKGFLPFFPNDAVDSNLPNPRNASQGAAEDIYQTMRKWFYLYEPGHNATFVRNIGTYDNWQVNTYQQGFATLIESLMIADQLAHSTQLRGIDDTTNDLHACLCKPKTEVAAEMRDYILQALKELVGQWADVYTAQLMQYNPDFNTTYGFPTGYGAIQSFSDHHFHYGYFLRAAAAIGRYDRDWLNSYLPFFERLLKDVANYNRTDTGYPFLRNFSPFYGHNWADGIGRDGVNQESTSEAINFSSALIELGLLRGGQTGMEWRDIGMYMYEQEILATEQYWFNQDATLSTTIPRPPVDLNDVRYNGNWPEQFVTFEGPDGNAWHSTLAGRVHQRYVDRATFFGGIAETYFIQMIPMSASTLYFGRNQKWLQATWQQYLLDTGASGNPDFKSENETFIAAWQARMPDSGAGFNGTGLEAALRRIDRQHNFKFYGTNTMAKYWAYTNNLLGQVDTSVVADIPAYGVFQKGSGRTFVAYNPTNQPIMAHFTGNGVSESFSVPAGSIASRSSAAGNRSTFQPSPITIPPGRLYLGPTTSPSPLPMTGQLTGAPGTWLPTNETYPFPRNSGDKTKIMPSLTIIPTSTGNCSDVDLPGERYCQNSNKAYAEWTGYFKGNLVGSRPFTRMTIYTNPALHAGWQQAEKDKIRSNTHVRVEYYFNATNTNPDRIEVYTLASPPGNTFVMLKNKMTSYYCGQYFSVQTGRPFPSGPNKNSGLYGSDDPNSDLNRIQLDDRFNNTGAKEFPPNVACGKIKVQMYGQAGSDNSVKVDVPVSVGTSPLLNRASWIQPPYDGGSCTP